eukprot:scaffold1594_cov401-Prasinococcus_capsulatus_cf.AAC.3
MCWPRLAAYQEATHQEKHMFAKAAARQCPAVGPLPPSHGRAVAPDWRPPGAFMSGADAAGSAAALSCRCGPARLLHATDLSASPTAAAARPCAQSGEGRPTLTMPLSLDMGWERP